MLGDGCRRRLRLLWVGPKRRDAAERVDVGETDAATAGRRGRGVRGCCLARGGSTWTALRRGWENGCRLGWPAAVDRRRRFEEGGGG